MMDLDKPLEDIIQSKRKPTEQRKPRVSRDRRDAVPYARPPPRSTEEKWVHDAYQGSGPRRSGGPGAGAVGRAGGASYGAGFVGASPRIEVYGLHYEVTVADLKTIFNQAGTIVQGPTIRYDRSGRSTGVAIIEYASAQQAKIAINKFDGAMTKGQTITIKLIAPPRPRQDPATQPQTGASLLARLGGGNGGGGSAPSGPSKGPRSGRGGTGARGGRGGAGPRAKRGPATQNDLDKELDGFMTNDAAGDISMA